MSVSPPGFNSAPSVVRNPYPLNHSFKSKDKPFPVDWDKFEQRKTPLNKMGKKYFNTENTKGLAMTVGGILAGPLLMKSSKMFKWNALVDYLCKAACFWGFLYFENGIIYDTLKKQIEYSGLSWNIFKRADQQ